MGDLISRQAAIECLSNLRCGANCFDEEERSQYTALSHAIAEIELLPSAQPTIMRSIGELVGYTGEPCPNCGRLRVERYERGLEICEKCNWCEQTKSYWLDEV